jgi:hypothetical protein
MRFFSGAILSVMALATGVIAVPISNPHDSSIQLRSADVLPIQISTPVSLNRRGGCSECGHSDNPSTGSDTLNINVDLTHFSHTDLDFINACVDALLRIDANVDKKKIVDVAVGLAAWSTAELDRLDAALVAVKAKVIGDIVILDAEVLKLLAKAKLTLSLTVAEIDCLRVFISTCLKAHVDLAADLKVKLLNWCGGILGYTHAQLEALKVKIGATINASVTTVVKAGDSIVDTTTTTVDVSVAACLKIKQSLKAYIEGLVVKAHVLVVVQLKALLVIVNAWLNGNLAVLNGLGLGVVSDLSVCLHIIAVLKSCGYDAVGVLGLDLSVLSKTKLIA